MRQEDFAPEEPFGIFGFVKFCVRAYMSNTSNQQIVNPGEANWILGRVEREIRAAGTLSFRLYLSEVPLLADLVLGRIESPVALWYTHPKRFFGKYFLYRFLIGKIKIIVFQNEMHRANFIRRTGFEGDTEILSGGVDTDPQLGSIPHELQPGYFVVVARYYKRKGADDLVYAINRCPKARFVIIGKGWAQRLKHFENVTVLESVDVLEPIYDGARALISPGIIEGGPLPVMEAANRGIPIVGRKVGVLTNDHWSNQGTNLYSTSQGLAEIVLRLNSMPIYRVYSNITTSWREFGMKMVEAVNR